MRAVFRSASIAWLLALSSCTLGDRNTDFTLMSADGPVSLKQFRGKVVLVNFGYTLCPDICPTTLATLSAGLGKLTPEEQKKTQVLFVSVDPERDSLDRLKMYAGAFHPNVMGISGAPTEVAAVVKKYGGYYKKAEVNSAAGYLVDHSTRTFVIGPNGKLETSLLHGAKADEVAQAVRKYLPLK